MGKLIEGQKLWWVSWRSREGRQQEVTVTKVGRKWAQLDNHERIDIETLVVDAGGYSPSGRCYLSREEYEQEVVIRNAWRKLKADLEYTSAGKGITIANIEEARQLLGLSSND